MSCLVVLCPLLSLTICDKIYYRENTRGTPCGTVGRGRLHLNVPGHSISIFWECRFYLIPHSSHHMPLFTRQGAGDSSSRAVSASCQRFSSRLSCASFKLQVSSWQRLTFYARRNKRGATSSQARVARGMLQANGRRCLLSTAYNDASMVAYRQKLLRSFAYFCNSAGERITA